MPTFLKASACSTPQSASIICNKQYADIYELTEELTKPGTPFQAILEHTVAKGNGPKDATAYLKTRLNDVAGRVPYQTTNKLRDGRYVAVVHRPMANGGWVATHEDITEAKHREESFRLLFEGNPVPMWVIDRETLRFLAVNEAAVAHYGYTREQFMAMNVADLRPTDDRERFKTFIRGLSPTSSSKTSASTSRPTAPRSTLRFIRARSPTTGAAPG